MPIWLPRFRPAKDRRRSHGSDLARVDDVDKRAHTLLSQGETVIDDKDHELDELDASLNPDIGHGSPDRCRSGA